jgi:hypothetical protein
MDASRAVTRRSHFLHQWRTNGTFRTEVHQQHGSVGTREGESRAAWLALSNNQTSGPHRNPFLGGRHVGFSCHCGVRICSLRELVGFQLRLAPVRDRASPWHAYMRQVYRTNDVTLPFDPGQLDLLYPSLLPVQPCNAGESHALPACSAECCAAWLPRPAADAPAVTEAAARRNLGAFLPHETGFMFSTASNARGLANGEEALLHRLAVPAHGWVEVIRVQTDSATRQEGINGGGCWFFKASGSGVWLNVGRTLAYPRRGDDMYASLVRRDLPRHLRGDYALPYLAALRGVDSVQIVDSWGLHHEIVSVAPECMHQAKEPPKNGGCVAGRLLRTGRDASAECVCDPTVGTLNCALTPVEGTPEGSIAADEGTCIDPGARHGSMQLGRDGPAHAFYSNKFCADHYCGHRCCASCTRGSSSRPAVLFAHVEKTGGSAVECAVAPLARAGSWVNLGHTTRAQVDACVAACEPREAVVVGVRDPYAFYLSAYSEYMRMPSTSSANGPPHFTMNFSAYVQRVARRAGEGPAHSPPALRSLTERLSRTCGDNWSAFEFLRTESLDADLSRLLHARRLPAMPLRRENLGDLPHGLRRRGYDCSTLAAVSRMDARVFAHFAYAVRTCDPG